MKTKVGIIGATGYAGLELVRLLSAHENVTLAAVSSVSFEGQPLEKIYPAMQGAIPFPLADENTVIDDSAVVFASLPHGLSEPLAVQCHQQGKILIDLGADFRLASEADYQQWYGGEYGELTLHQTAVYGLPELFRQEILSARLIANPGCYPTAIALGIAPLLQRDLIDPTQIIIDAKSGVTGAGRGLTQNTHYPECNENCAPYKIAEHRHTPEIEQTLSKVAGSSVRVTFVPHLLPVNRGILATIYLTPTQEISIEELQEVYRQIYQEEPFVRLKPCGTIATLKDVKYSNFCDLSIHQDPRTNRIIVVSAIDNMVKGAAGQAIQNMNLLCGFPETMGLTMLPPSF